MRRTALLGTLLAALLAPFATAHAYSDVSVRVSTPEFGIRIGAPVYRPVPVYGPVPVYAPIPVYAPAPVYAPVPVYGPSHYYAPAPVFVPAPRVIYPAPVFVHAPRIVVPAPRHYGAPAGVWVAPRHLANRHWKDRRGERRDQDRDRGSRRAGYGF